MKRFIFLTILLAFIEHLSLTLSKFVSIFCLLLLQSVGWYSNILLKSVRVHFAYGSDGRSFFVEYS